eukprot:g20722.t1
MSRGQQRRTTAGAAAAAASGANAARKGNSKVKAAAAALAAEAAAAAATGKSGTTGKKTVVSIGRQSEPRKNPFGNSRKSAASSSASGREAESRKIKNQEVGEKQLRNSVGTGANSIRVSTPGAGQGENEDGSGEQHMQYEPHLRQNNFLIDEGGDRKRGGTVSRSSGTKQEVNKYVQPGRYSVIFYDPKRGFGLAYSEKDAQKKKQTEKPIFFHITRVAGNSVPEKGDIITGKEEANERGKFLAKWSGGTQSRDKKEEAGKFQRLAEKLAKENTHLYKKLENVEEKLSGENKHLHQKLENVEARLKALEKNDDSKGKRLTAVEKTVNELATSVNACEELFTKVGNLQKEFIRIKPLVLQAQAGKSKEEADNEKEESEEKRRKTAKGQEQTGATAEAASGSGSGGGKGMDTTG